MKMTKLTALMATLLASASLIGCSPEPSVDDVASTPPTSATEEDHGHPHPEEEDAAHGHGTGPHDGTLADWGGGAYHVEFTVDHDKQETVVYVLGDDEKTPSPVSASDGKLLLTIVEPATQLELVAEPQPSDPPGTSSRFVGQHENLGIVQEFAGTISGEVDGTPYAGEFKEEPHLAH